MQGKEFVAGCGRVLCGAVSHGYAWCGKEIAVRRGEVWFSQVWSRKVWQGMGFMARSGIFRLGQAMLGGAVWGMDIKVF
jgi:hypothetical protein